MMNGRMPEQTKQPGALGMSTPPPRGSFPANKEDVQKFILDIDRAIFGEQQQQQLLQAMQQGAGNIGNTIGQLAGSLVVGISQRRAKEQGVKMHIKLAINGAQRAIKDLSQIAMKAGIAQVTKEDAAMAANVAGEIIQQSLTGGQPPQQQPQQVPQQAPQQVPQQPGALGVM